MTDSKGFTLGVGTKIQYWDSSAGEWKDLAKVHSATGWNKTRETIETTDLDATDGYVTKKGGFRDPGTVTLNMSFTRAQYDVLNSHFENDNIQNYGIILPDDENTSFEFEGLVTELPLPIEPKDKLTMDVVIEFSGKPVTSSGSFASVT